ncbi:flagellar basal body-associated protein FliL [Gracilibacillus oryzae]|uniref:Flagellar basal body-associated protein FliL n=1 Tax=Gracilibacillus oryzae TaxID=1672701 RepID=A0A7C8GWA7_9BACI|nr:flagellar basal body-associated protein FliL [Gracilibacillus oryzae]KAB8138745.1 flagellar basal body-associated protein FliL [Gracilibacillus oryzae]
MNPKLLRILVISLVVIIIGGGTTLYFLINSEVKADEELTIDEMVKYSYTTEEMKTDLKDGSFVLIQFQFITDGKKSVEEIAKREFQVKNEFIKESMELTEADFRENLPEIEKNIKDVMNQKMTEGKIVEVLIINKVIQ